MKRRRYKCPECEFTHGDALQVVAHRVKNHPKCEGKCGKTMSAKGEYCDECWHSGDDGLGVGWGT